MVNFALIAANIAGSVAAGIKAVGSLLIFYITAGAGLPVTFCICRPFTGKMMSFRCFISADLAGRIAGFAKFVLPHRKLGRAQLAGIPMLLLVV